MGVSERFATCDAKLYTFCTESVQVFCDSWKPLAAKMASSKRAEPPLVYWE